MSDLTTLHNQESSRYRLVLALILAGGFFLRFHGLGFGLPYRYHADEPILINHALAFASGDLNPHFFRIPPLCSYLVFLVYGLLFIAGKLAGMWRDAAAFEHVFLSDPTLFYLAARATLGLIPGTASIYALYALTKRHFGRTAALWSSAFLAVSYLPVRDSHYAYTDMLLILIQILGFQQILGLIEDPAFKRHVRTGLLIGLASAVKYNGVFLAVPYGAASLLGGERKSFLKNAAASLAAAAVTFILLNPYAVLDGRFFLSEMTGENAAHAGGTPLWHHLSYSLAESQGIPFLFAALAGFVLAFSGRVSGEERRKWAVIGSFVLAYYAVLVTKGQYYDRYVLPLIPFLCMSAALVMDKIHATGRRPVLVLTAILVLFIPLIQCFFLSRIITQKDTRAEAKIWFEKNIPPGTPVALGIPFYMPRLDYSEAQLRARFEKIKNGGSFSGAQRRRLEFALSREAGDPHGYILYYFSSSPEKENDFLFSGPFMTYDLSAMQDRAVRYAVLAGDNELAMHPEFARELRQQGRRIAVFSPYRKEERSKMYDSFALTGLPFTWRELANRDRPGPVLEVYELRQPGEIRSEFLS